MKIPSQPPFGIPTLAVTLALLAGCADPSPEVDGGESTSADDPSATDADPPDASSGTSSSTGDATTSGATTTGATTTGATTSGATMGATMGATTGATTSDAGDDSTGEGASDAGDDSTGEGASDAGDDSTGKGASTGVGEQPPDCAIPHDLGSALGVVASETTCGNLDTFEFSCVPPQFDPDAGPGGFDYAITERTYRWTAPAQSVFVIDVTSPSWATIVAERTACPEATELSCAAGASGYRIVREFTAGESLEFVVEVFDSDGWAQEEYCGQFEISIAQDPHPVTDTEGYRRVFVTSDTHVGNFGGLTQADALCQAAADAANLGGTFMAWLSVGDESPATRFDTGGLEYRRMDGDTLATGWYDLTDGSLAGDGYWYDEEGVINYENWWSNTTAFGTSQQSWSCSGWTSASSGNDGAFGAGDPLIVDGAQGDSWSEIAGVVSYCNYARALLCVEQQAHTPPEGGSGGPP